MKDWLPLIAVVVAQFVLVGLYFAKQLADDRRRWHEKRLDAYRALSHAARSAAQVFATAEEPDDLDDWRMTLAMNEADACMLDIDLLSSPDVREAATAVSTVLEMCVVFDPRTSPAFPAAQDLLTARYDFEQAVRAELGVKSRKRMSKEDRELLTQVETADQSDDNDS